MSAEKLSPRQQMIGIMYLVLLAMLAMNASKDLLNAFIFLEDGIDVTTKNFNNTNQTIYTKISNASATGSRLAVQTDKNAVEIGKSSNKLFNEIEKDGPKVSVVVCSFVITGNTERLARWRSCPNRSIVWPICKFKGH